MVVGDAGLDEQAHDEVRERIRPVELLGQLGLEAVADETVRIKLINPLRPAVLSAPDASFWYLIMPIRLPD